MRRRRLTALALGLAALPLLSVLTPGPAGAAEGGVVVRNVDTREYPTVRLDVLVNGTEPKLSEFTVRENNKVVPGGDLEVRPLKQTAKPVGTVLVVDTSGSMKPRIEEAKAAARSFVSAKAPNEWIAIVSFSNQAALRSDFTQDAGALTAAINSLDATGETALWDGLTTGAQLFDKHPEYQPNVVLLSDGADTVSSANEAAAVAVLKGKHAAVFAVAIASPEFKPEALQGLVAGSGGSLLTSTDPRELSAQFAKVRQAIENQFEVVYKSAGTGGPLTVALSVGNLSTEIQTRAGTNGVATAPAPAPSGGGLLTGRSEFKYVIMLMALLAAGLLAFAVASIFGERQESIDEQLQSYVGADAAVDGELVATTRVENSIVQRAVGITSKLAERGGTLAKVEALLEQANLPLRPAEALFFYATGVTLLGALALLGAPTLPVGIMFTAIVAIAPLVVVKQLRKRRLKAFEQQLPDTLNLLAGSLRAGYSFLQGVEAVAQETSDPMAKELRRVLAEARLGRPLEEALQDVAVRMQSLDFDWAVMAIRIQREVGGNLAELLTTVADTMVQRSRLRGEVKTLTAEGRLSAIIMGLLPLGLGGFMFMSSPEYIQTLFQSFAGWAMVIGSAIAGLAGFAWLQKIIKIEV
jgi:tight adherence protein B